MLAFSLAIAQDRRKQISKLSLPTTTQKSLCHRRTGIGADFGSQYTGTACCGRCPVYGHGADFGRRAGSCCDSETAW